MRLAAVQFKGDRNALVAARERSTALADGVAADADLVVLPEMACTGYLFPSRAAAEAVCEPADGATFQAWRQVCRRHACWLVGGMAERAGDALFNSALVIDPGGDLAFVYRKTLLYDADRTWAVPGDSGYARFDTAAGSFGVGICMDLNDPRFVLWAARSRLDAIAFPTNWVDEDVDVWPYWHERVEPSGAALVAANTWGSEPGVRFTGRSAILRDGAVLASTGAQGDGVIRASLG